MIKNEIYNNMDKEILFSESQKFKQWWLWLILLGINGLLGVAVFYQIVSGDQPGDYAWLLSALGISLLLIILFFNLRLDTHIKKDGVYVRFLPFNRSFKKYAWESLSKSFVRKYSAMGEFGGWGMKWDFSFRGKAMNISGDKGLQLEFPDRQRLLIGTNKPDELKETLTKIGQYKQ